MQTFGLKDEHIKLGQLLKATGLVGSGGPGNGLRGDLLFLTVLITAPFFQALLGNFLQKAAGQAGIGTAVEHPLPGVRNGQALLDTGDAT